MTPIIFLVCRLHILMVPNLSLVANKGTPCSENVKHYEGYFCTNWNNILVVFKLNNKILFSLDIPTTSIFGEATTANILPSNKGLKSYTLYLLTIFHSYKLLRPYIMILLTYVFGWRIPLILNPMFNISIFSPSIKTNFSSSPKITKSPKMRIWDLIVYHPIYHSLTIWE